MLDQSYNLADENSNFFFGLYDTKTENFITPDEKYFSFEVTRVTSNEVPAELSTGPCRDIDNTQISNSGEAVKKELSDDISNLHCISNDKQAFIEGTVEGHLKQTQIMVSLRKCIQDNGVSCANSADQVQFFANKLFKVYRQSTSINVNIPENPLQRRIERVLSAPVGVITYDVTLNLNTFENETFLTQENSYVQRQLSDSNYFAQVKISLGSDVVKHFIFSDSIFDIFASIGGFAVTLTFIFWIALKTVFYVDTKGLNTVASFSYEAFVAEKFDSQEARSEWLRHVAPLKLTLIDKIIMFTNMQFLVRPCASLR